MKPIVQNIDNTMPAQIAVVNRVANGVGISKVVKLCICGVVRWLLSCHYERTVVDIDGLGMSYVTSVQLWDNYGLL